MDKLSGEERRDNEKVEQALSYFDELRVEREEDVAGLQLRQNQDKYYAICREFMPNVVGRNRFKAGMVTKQPFTGVVTRSDEAFALLCIDNVLDICKEIAMAEYSNIGLGVIARDMKTKYTSDTDKRWTGGNGIDMFNALVMAVGMDRKERGEQFDKMYATKEQKRQEELHNKKWAGKGRKTTNVAMEKDALDDIDE